MGLLGEDVYDDWELEADESEYSLLNPREGDENEVKSNIGQPGFLESFIPIWGSGRAAIADYQEGNYISAGLNAALTGLDIFTLGSLSSLAKVGIKTVKPFVWKVPIWEKKKGIEAARAWMERRNYLVPYQDAHHWLVPQAGWGRNVPDWIKNQPWNIMPMKNKKTHARLRHRFKKRRI